MNSMENAIPWVRCVVKALGERSPLIEIRKGVERTDAGDGQGDRTKKLLWERIEAESEESDPEMDI